MPGATGEYHSAMPVLTGDKKLIVMHRKVYAPCSTYTGIPSAWAVGAAVCRHRSVPIYLLMTVLQCHERTHNMVTRKLLLGVHPRVAKGSIGRLLLLGSG